MDTKNTFILQSNLDGRYLPGTYTWIQAQEALKTQTFVTVRRLDEALAKTGRA